MPTRLRPLPERIGLLTRSAAAAAILLGAALVAGCATYTEDLQRGIDYYKNNEHERSLALFRVLESDVDSLQPKDRVRYYFYRGMTDYRLITDKYDVSADARHWLGLAKAAEEEFPESLNEKEAAYLKEALDELNRKAYGGDADADTDEEAPKAKKSKASKSDDADEDEDEKPKKKKKKADD